MFWNTRKHSTPVHQHNLRPGVETLEDRLVPACTVTTAYGGLVVIITGDDNPNDVAILQDDANNTLKIFCDDPVNPVAVFTSSQIVKVTTDLKGGNDNLWWGLADGSHLQFSKDGYLSTGADDDTVLLDFWHGIGQDALLQGSLKIAVDTGDGNDSLDADFGRKHGGQLALVANMGTGDDNASARMWGDITGGANVKFDLQGGAGKDTLDTWNTFNNLTYSYSSLKIAGDATFQINMNGGSDDDTLYATYGGELDGKLILRFYGGMGNDTIKAAQSDNMGIFLKAGSTGQLDAIFQGDQGDDLLAITLKQDPGTSVKMTNALMDGGAGYDLYNWVDTTANLTKINFEGTYPWIIWNLNAQVRQTADASSERAAPDLRLSAPQASTPFQGLVPDLESDLELLPAVKR